MLDALFGFVFEMVLNLVGAAIAKLFGADDVAEAGSIIVGIGILAIVPLTQLLIDRFGIVPRTIARCLGACRLI